MFEGLEQKGEQIAQQARAIARSAASLSQTANAMSEMLAPIAAGLLTTQVLIVALLVMIYMRLRRREV